MLSKNTVQRIKSGETLIWQRRNCNAYFGKVLRFVQKGTAIRDAVDLSEYNSCELNRISSEANSINRYLIYVPDVGLVSVAATTIEKQNPKAKRTN